MSECNVHLPLGEVFSPYALSAALTRAVSEAKQEGASSIRMWTVLNGIALVLNFPLDENGRLDLSKVRVESKADEFTRGAATYFMAHLISVLSKLNLHLIKNHVAAE